MTQPSTAMPNSADSEPLAATQPLNAGTVGAQRVCDSPMVVHPSTAAERAEWDAFVQSHPFGRHYQLSWWLRHHRRRFVRSGITAVRSGSDLLAGASWFDFGLPVPGLNLTVVSNALLVRPDSKAALSPLLDALAGDCRRRGSILLQFEAYEREFDEPIRRHFARYEIRSEPVWKLYHPGNWRDLRVPLYPHTEDEVLKGFSQLARRQIRKTEKEVVDISDTVTDENIKIGYDLWLEFAARKALRHMRRFEDFRTLVLLAQEHGVACLLIARINSEPAAMTFCVMNKSGAWWLVSAYREKFSEVNCTRLLLWRTMQRGIRDGVRCLYLGGQLHNDPGVTAFKMRFNPQEVDNTRFATIIFKPRLQRLARPFISDLRWAGRLKRFYISRRGGGTDMTLVGRQEPNNADRDAS